MQYGALAANKYRQRISGATGKDTEHGSSNGCYKTRRRTKKMTILNKPECIYRPLESEYGNTAKGKRFSQDMATKMSRIEIFKNMEGLENHKG